MTAKTCKPALSWHEISCDVDSSISDLVAECLASLTKGGVCTDNRTVDAFSTDDIPENSLETLRAYLPGDTDVTPVIESLTRYLSELSLLYPDARQSSPRVSIVTAGDWEESWKVNFRPLRAGRRLIVTPTWESPPVGHEDLIIQIDPGMAFGTGGHETTRLCLELLESVMDHADADPKSFRVLDVGTGSGILAIAAALLGADEVRAIDIDAVAVEVAESNILLNGLAGRILCDTAPLSEIHGKYDVILANILAEELVRLAARLAALLAPGASIILSGILAEKEKWVLKSFTEMGLEHALTRHEGEWSCLHLRMSSR